MVLAIGSAVTLNGSGRRCRHFPTSSLAMGSDTITAVYSGDSGLQRRLSDTDHAGGEWHDESEHDDRTDIIRHAVEFRPIRDLYGDGDTRVRHCDSDRNGDILQLNVAR